MRIHSVRPQNTFKILLETNWKKHPLGEIENWDPVLVQSLNFILNTQQPSFIFWQAEGYCFYNDGYIPILGSKKHPQSLGAPAGEVWKEIWTVDTNPQFVEAMKGNATWNVDRMVPIERDGRITEAYFTYGYSPLFSEEGEVKGVIVTALETTSNVITRREIDQTSEQLSRALEIMEIGFYDWDIVTNKIVFNQKMQEDWGITAGTPLTTVLEHIHPEDTETVKEAIKNAVEKKEKYNCVYRILKNGRVEWVEARGLVSYEDNKPVRFFGTSMLITDDVRINYEKEEEKSLRETFVSALTHDLRTPLTAAKMSAQLLMRIDDAVKKQQYLNRIVNNMNRADEMIRDLLDANRMKAGDQIPIEKRHLELNQTINGIVAESSSIHGDRFRFIESEPIEGEWDDVALTRILDNLISNALKYGDPNFPITISVKKENGMAEICVGNRGSEISQEDQVKIFNPYHRTSHAHQTQQKGWGIGLSLVRALSEAHGGNVQVQSSAESGTKFIVRLPLG